MMPPSSLKGEAERLAKLERVALNQRIGSAVARKIGAARTAEAFLRLPAAGASATA
jgi:hypothetical protein